MPPLGEVRALMIKIGLYSEDLTLHPLLSSALGTEFQLSLRGDRVGMEELVAAGECNVMILDLHSIHDSLRDRLECSQSLIELEVPAIVIADDGLRSSAF